MICNMYPLQAETTIFDQFYLRVKYREHVLEVGSVTILEMNSHINGVIYICVVVQNTWPFTLPCF